MTTYARNLPDGSGQPAPPPPPELIAASQAARDANATFTALCLDPNAGFNDVYAAWDAAAAADSVYYRLLRAERARAWEGVQPR